MPAQPRNVLTIARFPGTNRLKVTVIDDHRCEGQLWLDRQQAKRLRKLLKKALRKEDW